MAIAINYVHRQTIGLLKDQISHEFSLDENGYANIVLWFQVAYALGYVNRSTGERKYYLSNLSAATQMKDLTSAIKARWICEQAHQQLKEELGLDHFEGRSWKGLHRHSLMSMIAYMFLQSRRLIEAGRKKKNQWSTPATDLASHTAGDHGSRLQIK